MQMTLFALEATVSSRNRDWAIHRILVINMCVYYIYSPTNIVHINVIYYRAILAMGQMPSMISCIVSHSSSCWSEQLTRKLPRRWRKLLDTGIFSW
jgi:hypothetical protein